MLKTLNLVSAGMCLSVAIMSYSIGDINGLLISLALGSLNLYLGVTSD